MGNREHVINLPQLARERKKSHKSTGLSRTEMKFRFPELVASNQFRFDVYE
jgi:hypothetical protein